jgi:hypothetical protein
VWSCTLGINQDVFLKKWSNFKEQNLGDQFSIELGELVTTSKEHITIVSLGSNIQKITLPEIYHYLITVHFRNTVNLIIIPFGTMVLTKIQINSKIAQKQ